MGQVVGFFQLEGLTDLRGETSTQGNVSIKDMTGDMVSGFQVRRIEPWSQVPTPGDSWWRANGMSATTIAIPTIGHLPVRATSACAALALSGTAGLAASRRRC